MRLLYASGWAFLTVLAVAAILGIAFLLARKLDDMPAWVVIALSLIFTFLLSVTLYYYAFDYIGR